MDRGSIWPQILVHRRSYRHGDVHADRTTYWHGDTECGRRQVETSWHCYYGHALSVHLFL